MGRRHREVCATDLDLDLDRLTSAELTRVRIRRREDHLPIEVEPADGIPWVYLTGDQPWERWAEDLVESGVALCPVCGESPGPREFCLFCHRDPAVWLPGLRIGEAIDPDFPAESTRFEPGKLAGGTSPAPIGRPPRATRSKPPARPAS